jgi:hypothetical protein
VTRVAIALALLTLGAVSAPRIAIGARTPSFIPERTYVRVFVQVEPHPDNRAFILAAIDGDVAVSQTRKQLDGDQAARSWWIDWREGLPAGELDLVAVLITTNGERPRARRPIHVLSTLMERDE